MKILNLNCEWQVRRLSEVADINPKKEDLDDDKPVSFIAMEDVSNEGRLLNTQDRLYGEVKKGYTAFKNQDVLLAKITPCFENGKRALVKNLKNGIGFGSTEFHVVRAKQELAIPQYLYYTVSAHRFKELAEANMTGSAGQKRVPTDFIKDYSIPVPTLPEQQKIADILSTVDEQIDNVDRLIEKTKELKKGLMQQLLTKGIGHTEFKETEVGVIPKEWEVKKLDEVCEIIMGQSPDSNSYNEQGKGLPFFQGKTEFGDIYPEVKKWCTQPKKVSEPLDILISVRAPVGEVNINKYVSCIGRGLGAIRSKNVTYYKFIYYIIQLASKELRKASQGSTFDAINSSDLKDLKIAIPNIQEQEKIADLIWSIEERVQEKYKMKEYLQQLKKGLMQQLLTGKIRVKVDQA